MYEYGVTMEGFKPLKFLEIVDLLEMKARELYGNDIRLDPSSRLGQDIQLMAYQEARIHEMLQGLYNSFNIETSEGVSLDNNVKFLSIDRKLPVKARGYITIEGEKDFIIPKGYKVSNKKADKVFLTLTEAKLIDGKATIPILAEKGGKDYNLDSGLIAYQFNPIPEVSKVYNEEPTFNGTDLEEDYELLERYKESYGKGGGSTVLAVKSALLDMEEVIDVVVEENDTDVEKDGLPPHSIHCIVYGGENQEVAETIFKAKAGGIQAYGKEYFKVLDDDNKVYNIGITRPAEKIVYVKVITDKKNEHLEDDIKKQVIKYIGGFYKEESFKGLKNSEDVNKNQILGKIICLGSIEGDIKVLLSEDGKEYKESNIEVEKGEIAKTSYEKVVVEYE